MYCDLYMEVCNTDKKKCNIWITTFSLFVVKSFVHQVPTASVTIEGASALNRVRWSSGGKEVAVGDSEGRVWIYDTGEVQMIIEYF